MGADHGEAIALVEPARLVIFSPDIEIDVARGPEHGMAEGGVHQPAAGSPVLEFGEDIDPAQLPILRSRRGRGNPYRAELHEADQPDIILGQQEDVLRQGGPETVVGEAGREMCRQIMRAEAMAEGIGIGPAREGRQSREILRRGRGG
jgi:hypothetical protein